MVPMHVPSTWNGHGRISSKMNSHPNCPAPQPCRVICHASAARAASHAPCSSSNSGSRRRSRSRSNASTSWNQHAACACVQPPPCSHAACARVQPPPCSRRHHINPSNLRHRRPLGRPQALPSQFTALAFVPAMCFDAACQARADQAFLIAVSLPIIIALSAIAYILRPPPKELIEDGTLFEDPATGALFTSKDGQQGVQPERDNKGELAFRPISFTPWPVDDSYEGERVRIPVGPIKDRQPRTFVFSRLLPRSEIVLVTLPRPLGLVFEYDAARKRTSVVDVVPGTGADQRLKMAQLNQQQRASAALPGDVLRAVTATNFVYPTRALFGAVAPERHVVVYGADKQSWSSVCGALRKGVVKDGEVTLVLERTRQAA